MAKVFKLIEVNEDDICYECMEGSIIVETIIGPKVVGCNVCHGSGDSTLRTNLDVGLAELLGFDSEDSDNVIKALSAVIRNELIKNEYK